MTPETDISHHHPASGLRAVFLVNFVAPNLVAVFHEMAARLATFTVLVSVPMESNRDWQPDHRGLDVMVQRSVTRRRHVTHPGGFVDEQFVHVPYDTLRRLRRLRPDVVMSLEMGARSVFAAAHARRRATAHVLCFFGSERTEANVGRGRLALRRVLARRADVVTFNGPSARRYLVGTLGVEEDRLLPWNYAADPNKINRTEIRPGQADRVRVLTIGQLVERKGVELALRAMIAFASAHLEVLVEWTVVGSGPLRTLLEQPFASSNLSIEIIAHLGPAEIRELYAEHEVLLFPTLADEWGLVVEEAFGSGLAVLGSVHSQSVETLLRNGENGIVFDPERPGQLQAALEQWHRLAADERMEMRRRARATVIDRTPTAAAEQLIAASITACERRRSQAPR